MKYTHPHLSDVKRIQFVLKKYIYNLGLKDCAEIWQSHSDALKVDWQPLPEFDDYLVEICKLYM